MPATISFTEVRFMVRNAQKPVKDFKTSLGFAVVFTSR
jgi:hypothetical protein